METEEKIISCESKEDAKVCDNVDIPRQVGGDSNIDFGLNDKLQEKIVKDDVLTVNDERDLEKSNEKKCNDFSDAGGKLGTVADMLMCTDDSSVSGNDVVRSPVTNETDHSTVKEEERESDSSVEFSSDVVKKNVNCNARNCNSAETFTDSTETTKIRFKEQQGDGSEFCDSETSLLVEESDSCVPVQVGSKEEDVDISEEKSVFEETGSSRNSSKRLENESESSDGLGQKVFNDQEPATESQDGNQNEYSGPSCLDHSSTVQLSNEENHNSDSDMDIDNDGGNSDPEFLSNKLPNESDPDGTTVSFMKVPNQSETYAPKVEGEAVINEDLISAMLFAPEDVIIECKDKKNFFYCNVCHCTVHNSIKNVKVHKKGKSHKAAMIKHKKAVVATVKNITSANEGGPHLIFLDCYIERYKPRGYYCRVCNFIAEKLKAMDDHVHGKWHETNICIMKTREIIAQQKDNTEKETKDEMKELDEEYYRILENERLKSWNSYSAAIADDVSKNKASINMESCYGMQDPSLYSDSQDGFPQNQYYQNFAHTMNQNMFSQSPAQVGPSLNPDASPLSQMRSNQQSSVFPYSQKNPIPDDSELKQAKLSTSSQSQENNSFFNVQFSVNKESDAEIVFEVINSLLQTYLKYQLERLPKSLFKLLHNKTEEHASHMNKFATNRIAEQSFPDLQNSKNRYQPALSANNATHSPAMYRGMPNKYVENRSYKRTYENETSYSEKSHDLPMDCEDYRSYQPPLMEDKTDESYHYLYSKDQIRKPVVPRNIGINKQNEHRFSRNLKEAEPTVSDFHCYKSSYNDDDSSKRIRHGKPFSDDTYRKYKNFEAAPSRLIRQNESANYNFAKQYRNDNNEKKECFINNLSQQYQHFKKGNSAARSSKQLGPYATDSSDVYVTGSNIEDEYSRKHHQNAQPTSHAMKKFRNSNFFQY